MKIFWYLQIAVLAAAVSSFGVISVVPAQAKESARSTPLSENAASPEVTSSHIQMALKQHTPPALSGKELEYALGAAAGYGGAEATAKISRGYSCTATSWTHYAPGVSILGPEYWIGYRTCYNTRYVTVHRGHFHFYPRPGWTHYHSFIPPSCSNSEPDFSSTPVTYTNYSHTDYSQGTRNGAPSYLTTNVYDRTVTCHVRAL